MSTIPSSVNSETVRDVHRQFVTGVTVVTTLDGDTPRGLAVNAFCSVSLEPPVVLVCVQTTSTSYPALFRSDHLAVNILAADQLPVLRVFAAKGHDKFASVEWTPGVHGSPIIHGCASSIEVEIGERLRASTHTVFIGHVIDARTRATEPLVYRAGEFFAPSGLTAVSEKPSSSRRNHATSSR